MTHVHKAWFSPFSRSIHLLTPVLMKIHYIWFRSEAREVVWYSGKPHKTSLGLLWPEDGVISVQKKQLFPGFQDLRHAKAATQRHHLHQLLKPARKPQQLSSRRTMWLEGGKGYWKQRWACLSISYYLHWICYSPPWHHPTFFFRHLLTKSIPKAEIHFHEAQRWRRIKTGIFSKGLFVAFGFNWLLRFQGMMQMRTLKKHPPTRFAYNRDCFMWKSVPIASCHGCSRPPTPFHDKLKTSSCYMTHRLLVLVTELSASVLNIVIYLSLLRRTLRVLSLAAWPVREQRLHTCEPCLLVGRTRFINKGTSALRTHCFYSMIYQIWVCLFVCLTSA